MYQLKVKKTSFLNKMQTKVKKLGHNVNLIYFESTPNLTENFRMTLTETFATIRRTFGKTSNMNVAKLLNLEITPLMKIDEFEKAIDALFETHDYDKSKSISMNEYRLFARDFIEIADSCRSKLAEPNRIWLTEDLEDKIKKAGFPDSCLFKKSPSSVKPPEVDLN